MKQKISPSASRSFVPTWSWSGSSNIRSVGLLREMLWVHVWDDANNLCLINREGEARAVVRAPHPLVGFFGSDDGRSMLALGEGSQVWWLDDKLAPRHELDPHMKPRSAAVDPLGEYAFVSGGSDQLLIWDGQGRVVHRSTTIGTFAHCAFVPRTGHVIAAAEHGLIACFDVRGNLLWKETVYSTIGGIAVNEDGTVVLLASFGHGLARFDGDGKRRGTMPTQGSPCLVTVDFSGENVLFAEIDGALNWYGSDGQVKGRRFLDQRPLSLAIDAIARFAVVGFESGNVECFGLQDFFEEREKANAPFELSDRMAPSGDRWSRTVFESTSDGESSLLVSLPDGSQGAVFDRKGHVHVFDASGTLKGKSLRLSGASRVLLRDDQWFVAATDRNLTAWLADRQLFASCTLSLFELSYIHLLAEPGELIVIENCDFIRRLSLPGTVVWERRLPGRVSSSAGRPSGECAVFFEDLRLAILDRHGKVMGEYASTRPMLVADLPLGWVTATIDEQVLRAHSDDGIVLWSTPLPWEPWRLMRVDDWIVASNVKGESMILSLEGKTLASELKTGQQPHFMKDRKGRLRWGSMRGNQWLLNEVEASRRRPIPLPDDVKGWCADRRGLWIIAETSLHYRLLSE